MALTTLSPSPIQLQLTAPLLLNSLDDAALPHVAWAVVRCVVPLQGPLCVVLTLSGPASFAPAPALVLESPTRATLRLQADGRVELPLLYGGPHEGARVVLEAEAGPLAVAQELLFAPAVSARAVSTAAQLQLWLSNTRYPQPGDASHFLSHTHPS